MLAAQVLAARRLLAGQAKLAAGNRSVIVWIYICIAALCAEETQRQSPIVMARAKNDAYFTGQEPANMRAIAC
jgi:hypothetical protein